jgi:hypothetical protein
MDRCQTKVRPHKINGIEIELIGDCGGLVDEIMKNLGPYGQQYIKRRMVLVRKETEPTSQSDSSE